MDVARQDDHMKKTIAKSLNTMISNSAYSLRQVVALCPSIKNTEILSAVLNSQRMPSVPALVDLCNLFDANVDDILFGESSTR